MSVTPPADAKNPAYRRLRGIGLSLLGRLEPGSAAIDRWNDAVTLLEPLRDSRDSAAMVAYGEALLGLSRLEEARAVAALLRERESQDPDVAAFIPGGTEHAIVAGPDGLKLLYGFARDRFIYSRYGNPSQWAVQEKLAAVLKEVMALPAMQERYRAAASTSGSLFLDDMQRFVRADAEVWRPVVMASGATAD